MPLLEAGDETALPRRLNGALSVVLPDVGDRLVVGYPVEHGEAGQCGAASVSADGQAARSLSGEYCSAKHGSTGATTPSRAAESAAQSVPNATVAAW